MAVSALVGIAAGAVTTAAIGFGLAAVAVGIGAAAVMNYAMDSMVDDAAVDTMGARTSTGKNTTASRKIIYGKCRVGGTIVYEDTNGTDNKFLHRVVVFCQGEIDSFYQIYLNDELAWGFDPDADSFFRYRGDYYSSSNTSKHIVLVNKKGGTDNETELPNYNVGGFIDACPSRYRGNSRLRGLAYTYIGMKYNQDHFKGKIPNITAIIKGRKVYNPFKDETNTDWHQSGSGHRVDDSSTWEYSDNPVLCLLDYMMDNKFGLGENLNSFDSDTAYASYAYCNNDVTLKDGSTTEKRYVCNGITDTQNSHRKNIQNILSSMNGAMLYSNGKFHIKAYMWETPHSQVLSDDMIIGNVQIATKQSKRENYNRVKGSFISEEYNYIKTDYPPQESVAYVADDGELLLFNYDLPMTTSNTMAQRLASLLLLRSRMQTTIKLTTNLKGLAYTVGDNIKFTNSQLGYNEKIFQITTLTIATNKTKGLEVQIEAIENNENIYTWNASTSIDWTDRGETTIGGGSMSPVTNISPTPSLNIFDNELSYALNVTFDTNTDPRLAHYEIKYKIVGDNTSEKTVLTASNEYTIQGLTNNTNYNVQVRSVSHSGIRSYWLGRNVFLNLPNNTISEVGYIVKDNLNEPTEQESRDALGRLPVSGDQFYILQTDSNNNVINTTLYTFEPTISFNYYETNKFSVEGSSGDDAHIKVDIQLGVSGVSPTWTVETVTDDTYGTEYNIFATSNTPSSTDFHNLTSQASTIAVLPFLRVENTIPNSLWTTENNFYSNSGYIKVTASWGANSESIFIFLNTEIRNT